MSCQFETDENTYIIHADRNNIYKVYRVEATKETELGGFKLDTAADDEALIDAAEIVIEENR